MKKFGFPVFVFALLVFVSMLIFYSCEKEESITSETNEESVINESLSLDLKKEITVHNGILKFDSYEGLERVHNYLAGSSNRFKELEWARDKGFISAYEAYEEMTLIEFESKEQIEQFSNVATWRTRDGELYLDKVIENFIYSVLFNDESILLVGNDLLKHRPDELLIYDATNLNEHYNLSSVEPKQVINVPQQSFEVQGRNIPNCSTVFCFNNGNQECKVTGSRYISSSYITGGNVINIFAYSVRNFRRGLFGAWYSKKADELEIAVEGFTPETDFNNSGFIIYTTVAADAEHSVVTDRGSGICMTEI